MNVMMMVLMMRIKMHHIWHHDGGGRGTLAAGTISRIAETQALPNRELSSGYSPLLLCCLFLTALSHFRVYSRCLLA
jgi:hypothetical protein